MEKIHKIRGVCDVVKSTLSIYLCLIPFHNIIHITISQYNQYLEKDSPAGLF